MNILIPHSWLLELLETSADPEDIQKFLSLSGPSVERIYEREGEPVYDIEVTTNRVDSMCVRGIAREAAVILTHAGIPSHLKKNSVETHTEHFVLTHSNASLPVDNQLPLPEIVNNPEFCNRVMCVVLKDVQHSATPDWMAKRLTQTDQNVHDAMIDITNYITHELGHPCHAFDYDKIMKLGGKIIVKEADAGKKFTTLDGEEYTTVGGEIVFENEQGEIIDLPAVKGTLNTSVDESTKNILFWIESLDAKKVRFASMTHAIRTVAAQLNEKHVDPELAPDVLHRGIQLYQELCDATIASDIHDEYLNKRSLQSIKVPLSTIEVYLGISLEKKTITSILSELGCEVDDQGEEIVVTPPSFRPDLVIPADIVEEIARIYGYHNLPSTLMDTAIPTRKPTDTDFDLENRVKHFLVDIGWQEVYTYSLVSEELALQSGYEIEQHIKIQNPLTDDRVYMRRTLIPSLGEVLDQNPMEAELSVFEIANVYEPVEHSLPRTTLWLTLLSSKSYRQVKGDVEVLLAQFFLDEVAFTPTEYDHPQLAQSAKIIVDGETELGQIHILKNGRIAVAIAVETLVKHAKSHPNYQPTSHTAKIVEDLTFTLPAKTLVGNVIDTMNASSKLVTSITLKDQYQHNFTFTISYQDPDSNLDSDQVTQLRKSLVELVRNDFQAELVGSV